MAHQDGNNGVVTKFNAAGSASLFSTYLGGSSGRVVTETRTVVGLGGALVRPS
ncbi:MAG: hypothetical protein IT318_24090 [Anaerolineales bacterium]|nr:hypothetical protein [Anaerolineales bacterium]